MSKTMKYYNELKFEGFPAIRLYNNNGSMVQYDNNINPTFDTFIQFLKDNGITWTEWKVKSNMKYQKNLDFDDYEIHANLIIPLISTIIDEN